MTIETKYGKLEGIQGKNAIEYRGIPYAKPPIGSLRWKAPEKQEPWEGIYRADHFRSCAMQPRNKEKGFYDKEFRDDPAYITEPSEDCLYLNIWTPADAQGKKLPVAMWIHGGAFIGGCGNEKEFDGAAYCRRAVILVTINYRMSLWGFLAHPWLSAESEQHVSGNYGTLDQIAALDWVYENIAAFGGDPENITVFGQSAGAMSTQTLISSPLTGNKISKAILQSGGGYHNGLNRDDITLAVQEEYGLEFSRLAGVNSLDEMRALPQEKCLALFDPFMQAVMPKSHGLFLVPNVDGYVLPEGYDALLDTSKIKAIPYLLGSTKDDILTTKKDVGAGKKSSLRQGCEDFAKLLLKHGRKPAYVYEFVRDLPGDDAGAFHSSELWYTFGTLQRAWRPFSEADYQLSDRMLNYWTNFMKTGDPNGAGLPEWLPYREEKDVITLNI